MAKMKLSLCGIFSLCCLFVGVFGSALSDSESDQLENSSSSPNPNSNPSEDSTRSFKCENFKALENDNQQLKKSHAEILKKFELLSQKFDQLENRISEDSEIWLLTPPLRGPPGKPGKDGKQGEKGEPGPKGDRGLSTLQSITSCSVAMEILSTPLSKKQRIYPHGNGTSLEVLCDFETDGGGWTIIQKRTKGPKEEFNQNWNEYVKGFGSLDGNFWLGLENIRALTQNGDQELRIQLEDFEGNKKYAKYSNFSISDASDFYKLTIGGFSGGSTLRDDMDYHNGQKFSTMDKDNDKSSMNCAVEYGGGGGWWFNSCADSNLNGAYYKKGETVSWREGIFWYSWKGVYYSLAKSEMKIRTKKP